jgi:hypothetical protein
MYFNDVASMVEQQPSMLLQGKVILLWKISGAIIQRNQNAPGCGMD